MTPLTMTALTEAWKNITRIPVERIRSDGSHSAYYGFPATIQRLEHGYVSITLAHWNEDGPTVMYRLIGDGETLEPVQ
jgi:hypothetical protein